MRRLPAWLIVLAVLALAVAMRVPAIALHPMHTDEAVNVFLIDGLAQGGAFEYRLHDHHGPTLFLLAQALLPAGGWVAWEAWMPRLITALAGALAAAGLLLHASTIGRGPALASAVLLALLAPFVFYGGVFIHESLLLALLVPWVAAVWAWRGGGGVGLAAMVGLLGGLLLATKETAGPIMLVLALCLVPGAVHPWRRCLAHGGVAVAAALVVLLLLFGDWGRAPGRALDLFRAVAPQFDRGVGGIHAHPVDTYLRWYLLPGPAGPPWGCWLLLALAAWGCWRHALAGRLALAALLLALGFSLLPYKTPWLALAILLPLLPAAGLGAAALLRRLAGIHPAVAVVAALLAVAAVAYEAAARSWSAVPDPRDPLVYAPSAPGLDRLAAELDGWRRSTDRPFTVQVVAGDAWPLPWYLRRLPAGFWTHPPEAFLPGAVLVEPAQVGLVAAEDFRAVEVRPGLILFLARLP
jgi:hypothetical protein